MQLAILLAVVYGAMDVVSRMVNYRATYYLGTVNGSFLNYFFGSIVCLTIVLVTGGGRIHVEAYLTSPWWMYFGAVCGLIAFILLMVGLNRVKVFQSSVLLLLGQLGGSMILDQIVYGDFTPREILGIALVAGGIIADKSLTSRLAAEKNNGGAKA